MNRRYITYRSQADKTILFSNLQRTQQENDVVCSSTFSRTGQSELSPHGLYSEHLRSSWIHRPLLHFTCSLKHGPIRKTKPKMKYMFISFLAQTNIYTASMLNSDAYAFQTKRTASLIAQWQSAAFECGPGFNPE